MHAIWFLCLYSIDRSLRYISVSFVCSFPFLCVYYHDVHTLMRYTCVLRNSAVDSKPFKGCRLLVNLALK
jgi:hypothetical protein